MIKISRKKNIEGNLDDLEFGNDFLDTTTKALIHERKN
jgi:hypothetical protein